MFEIFTNRTDPLLKYSWFPNSDILYLSHLHEIIYSFIFYSILFYYIAPILNSIVFGKCYNSIQKRKLKLDFDIHTVSMVQAFVSLYILYPSLYIPITSGSLQTYYDDLSSMISSLSAGYFIWDLYICKRYFDIYGFEFLAHAISSLYVALISLRPLCQVWIGKFLLFEASTPFVNINWYIIQLNSSSNGKFRIPLLFNALNGICLLVVFFVVRLVWGNIANVIFFKQMWNVRHSLPMVRSIILIFLNFTLNILNFVWFGKMIKIARKIATKSKSD